MRRKSSPWNESLLEERVVSRLRDHGWIIEPEPDFGMISPDIVAKNQGGHLYVFEIKRVRHSPSFADLAQIKAFGRAIAEALNVPDVRTVFVTEGEITPSLESLSQELGVQLLHLDSPFDLHFDRWVEQNS